MSNDDYRMKLSEEEQEYMFSEDLAIRLIGFLQIRQRAIDIINRTRVRHLRKSMNFI